MSVATDPGDGDLREDVRRSDRALGVTRQAGLKLRATCGGAECRHRFPRRHVDERRAAGDAAMELRGDIAGLALHELAIRRPRFHERVDVIRRDVKGVEKDDWPLVAA